MDENTLEALKDNIDAVAELSLMFYRSLEDRDTDEETMALLISVFMGTILYHE